MFSFKKKKVEEIENKSNLIYHYQKSLKMLQPKIDPSEQTNFLIVEEDNTINFDFIGDKRDYIEEFIPMKTLELITVCSNGSKDYWEAAYDEYLKVYENETQKMIKKELEPIVLLLKRNENSEFFLEIDRKLGLTIQTVYDTLKESKTFNKQIPEKTKEKSINVLLKFSNHLNEIQKERREKGKDGSLITNQNLEERLELEAKYIEEFIERNPTIKGDK